MDGCQADNCVGTRVSFASPVCTFKYPVMRVSLVELIFVVVDM